MSAMRSTPQRLDATERATRERNIFMLCTIRKVSFQPNQLKTSTTFIYSRGVRSLELWWLFLLHNIPCNYFHVFSLFVATWHGCCCEKRNDHHDFKLRIPLEYIKVVEVLSWFGLKMTLCIRHSIKILHSRCACSVYQHAERIVLISELVSKRSLFF